MFLMASGSAGKTFFSSASGNITSIILGFALTLVWVSNAIPRPPAKRSAAMAIVNGFGNIGSLYVRWVCVEPSRTYNPPVHRISAYTWKTEWGPAYHPSMIIGIAGLTLATVLAYGTP